MASEHEQTSSIEGEQGQGDQTSSMVGEQGQGEQTSLMEDEQDQGDQKSSMEGEQGQDEQTSSMVGEQGQDEQTSSMVGEQGQDEQTSSMVGEQGQDEQTSSMEGEQGQGDQKSSMEGEQGQGEQTSSMEGEQDQGNQKSSIEDEGEGEQDQGNQKSSIEDEGEGEQNKGEQTSPMEGEQGGGMGMEQKVEELMTAFDDHVDKALRHREELDELFRILRDHKPAVSQLPRDKKDHLAALLLNIADVLELCKKPEEDKDKKKKKKPAASLKMHMGDCTPFFKSSSRPPPDAEPSVVAPLLKQARDILGDSGAGPNKEEVVVLYEWTTSYVDEERLYGWDDEAKDVADALAGPDKEDSHAPPLFRAAGIFGIHGSGKTALAQKVFVHDRIKDTFPLRLWVCVGPTPPDDDKQQQYEVKVSLLYRMLDNLGLDTYKVEQVVNDSKAVTKHGGDGNSDAAKESKIGVLLFILHVALAKTSYLIVFDDIRAYDPWYTNLALPPPADGEWSDRLGYGLPKLNKSAVLVTCRKEEHARAMVRTGRVFHPPLLEVHDAWKLFEREYVEAKKKQLESGGKYEVKDDMLYNELKWMQKEIVGKCLGLPVAIVEAAKGFAHCDYEPYDDEDHDAKTTQATAAAAKDADAGEPADAAAGDD